MKLLATLVIVLVAQVAPFIPASRIVPKLVHRRNSVWRNI